MRLETDRLWLSRPLLSDAPQLLSFLGDADAMQHTLRLADVRACRRHIAGHECQRKRLGYGPWTVRSKCDQRIVGFGGLYDDPFDPGWGAEIGYRFAPNAWGRGLATELVRFCLALAQRQFGLAVVRAFVHPANTASRRVLEKAGFEAVRFLPDMNRHLYEHRR
jgi:RimJ/RimL family protein N-acetyltransferase